MKQLTLRWHGHACFSLTCDDFTVVFDPYEDNYVPGFAPLKVSGDLVLCSHQHNDTIPPMLFPRAPVPRIPFRSPVCLPSTTPSRGSCGGRTPSICCKQGSFAWPTSGIWAVN